MKYYPKKKPKASDLSDFGVIYDRDSLTDIVRNAWYSNAVRPDVFKMYCENIGKMAAVEIHGSLHVEGDFDTGAHGIAILYISGDLIVEGCYSDPSEPQTFVFIGGNLIAKNVVSGGRLEVHGNLETRHLAGDYNDHSAVILGSVRATTFMPENHYFEFLNPPEFDLVIGEDAFYRVPEPMQNSIKCVPDRVLEAYLKKRFIMDGVFDDVKIRQALRKGKEILVAEPKDIDPELALFTPSIRKKMQADPLTITSVNLSLRSLKTLPTRLSECLNLTKLNLDFNDLETLDLTQFPNLRSISLDSNPISEIPISFRSLTQLRSLSLRYTKRITALPDWFSEFTELRELWITASALESFPTVLSELPKLKKLWIWHWYDVSPKFLKDGLETIGKMKLSHLGLLQGSIPKLPDDLSALSNIKNIEILADIDVEDLRKLKKAVPNLKTKQ